MLPIILEGGSKTQQDQYTGPENELTVDQSNRDLRLHDGATPGGHIIQTRENADDRYQEKSEELAGLLGFGVQDRGWLVRLGPADYRLRKITVNGQNLTIENDDGYGGDPIIGLKSTIESEHTWTGQQLFQEVVQFSSGINANVAGDLTGNSTGLHVGNVTGNVTGDAHGNHTGAFDGDASFIGYDVEFEDDQIPLSKIAGLDDFINSGAFPLGGIILWSGSIIEIPAGWVLCDGNNGTPDLRDRFIVGAGGIYEPLATGGLSEHTHLIELVNSGSHTHTGDVEQTVLDLSQIPSHQHGSGVTDNSASDVFNHGALAANPTTPNSIESNSSDGTQEGKTTSVGGGLGHDHGLTINESGLHTHDVIPAVATHIPPYYALCYLMRVLV